METDEKFNSQLQHILDNSFNKHCFECGMSFIIKNC